MILCPSLSLSLSRHVYVYIYAMTLADRSMVVHLGSAEVVGRYLTQMGLNPNAPPFIVSLGAAPLDSSFCGGGGGGSSMVLCNRRHHQPGRMHWKYAGGGGGGVWCYYWDGSAPYVNVLPWGTEAWWYPFFHRCSHLEHLPKPPADWYTPPLVGEAQQRPHAAAAVAGVVLAPADVEGSSGGLQEKAPPVKQTSNAVNCGGGVAEDGGGRGFGKGGRTKRPRHGKIIASTGTEHQQSQCVWVPKDGNLRKLGDFREDACGVSTVMIRNIPNRYRKMLIQLLDKHCEEQNKNLIAGEQDDDDSGNSSASQYDFLYLPIDFRNKGNLGYAFVNFTSPAGARRLFESMDGRVWEEFRSRKICRIWPARIQGRRALVENFKSSVFRCESDEFLPVAFSPPRRGYGSTPASDDGDGDHRHQQRQSGSGCVIGSRRWTGPAA